MPDLSATEEQISGLAALVGIAVVSGHLLVGAVLVLVARRIGQRLGGPWRLAIWPPILALPLPACGVGLTVVLLVRAFGSLADIDAGSRATALARAISEAMNGTSLGVLLAWALYAATAVALAIGHLKRAPG